MLKFLANGSRMAAIAATVATVFIPLNSQARPAGQGSAAGNAQGGKAVFTAQKCGTCHGADAQGGSGSTAGPQIAPPPVALPAFTEALRNPKDPMPAFSTQDISDAQAADLYAFLKSSATAPAQTTAPAAGNAENGKVLYVKIGCYECHDRDAEGAGTGPRLAPNPLPWAAFSHQVRLPVNSMPPYTAKVLSDKDLADIYAFLQTIPKAPALSTIPLQ